MSCASLAYPLTAVANDSGNWRPYTDNQIHYRECATLVEAGYEVSLVAVSTTTIGPES
jgi:hypothetical protein